MSSHGKLSPGERIQMLAHAQKLLAAVARDLDDRTSECPTCGQTRHAEREEAITKLSLSKMVVKLSNAMERISPKSERESRRETATDR